jgi:peptide/nickel transport system substrate-binding protein
MAIDRESMNKDLLLGLTGVPASFWDALLSTTTRRWKITPLTPLAERLRRCGWVDSNGDGVRDKDGVELVLSYGTTIGDPADAQAVIQQQWRTSGSKSGFYPRDDIFFGNYGDGWTACGSSS